MDKHLEGLPRDGPLGLFFEAAADGLSQNPFISLDEKLEHLEWFRQYFVKYEEDLLNMDAVQSGDLDTRKFFYPDVTISQTLGWCRFLEPRYEIKLS